MKRVCVSFRKLYEANGMYLKLGGYIDADKNERGECYNLIGKYDEILAEDGDAFYVVKEFGNTVVLESVGEENKVQVYLTKEEYQIAAF